MDILTIGEPLSEFSSEPTAPSSFLRKPGGDTLNAAIYLARLRPDLRIGYLSRLGDDWMSDWMRSEIASEGVDVSAIVTEPGGRPGLSFIQTAPDGERAFLYWRDRSPARRMFADDDAPELATLKRPRLILFSAVLLAVLPDAARARLLAGLQVARERGAEIAFDPNYRPTLWRDHAKAVRWVRRALEVCDVFLPSFDDARALFPDGDTAEDVLREIIKAMPRGEIVLTTGGGDVLHRLSDMAIRRTALPPPVAARDTTAAGDSFDAAFLAARMAGAGPEEAILAGARLAAVVVQHPGAIIPRHAMPKEATHALE